MSRRTNRSKATTSTRPPVRRPLPNLAFLLSPLLWKRAAWVSVVAVAIFGLNKVDAFARENLRPPVRLEWVNLPEWLQDPYWRAIVDNLAIARDGLPLISPGMNAFDEETPIAHWVYGNLARSAWIDRIERVALVADGRVRVHARFRRPFAAIERDGICYSIDENGVRLPMDWYANAGHHEPWLRIRGVRAPIPPMGQRWQGNDLQAGLALVKYFEKCTESNNLPFRGEIAAIDVGYYDEIIGGLRISTHNPRTYIDWGHAPDQGKGVESTAEQKLATLIALYNLWGGLSEMGVIGVRAAPHHVESQLRR